MLSRTAALCCMAEKDSSACRIHSLEFALDSCGPRGGNTSVRSLPSPWSCPGPETSENPCQTCAWPRLGSGSLGASSHDQSLRRQGGLGWATWGGERLGSDREIPVIFPRRGRRHGQFVVVLGALG